MSNIPRYAPSYRRDDGEQTAYTAGLSYFPDSTYAAMPLGDISAADLAAAGGTAIAGPAGGIAASLTTNVIQRWFGGSAVDAARLARVNYFADLAARTGNVAAAQLMLGAVPYVSGNEHDYWTNAIDLVRQEAPDVMAEAERLGPISLPNNGDTATNYPGMRRVTQAWAAAHPIAAVTGAASGAFADFVGGASGPVGAAARGVSPVLILAGLGALAFALSRRRR